MTSYRDADDAAALAETISQSARPLATYGERQLTELQCRLLDTALREAIAVLGKLETRQSRLAARRREVLIALNTVWPLVAPRDDASGVTAIGAGQRRPGGART